MIYSIKKQDYVSRTWKGGLTQKSDHHSYFQFLEWIIIPIRESYLIHVTHQILCRLLLAGDQEIVLWGGDAVFFHGEQILEN